MNKDSHAILGVGFKHKIMPPVQNLKQFVNDRLAAAAEEIFGVFQQTVSELENELKRQRELLDVFRNQPVVYLKTKDQQLQVTEQEDSSEQESRPSLDREEPEHPHNDDEKQVDVNLLRVKSDNEVQREEEPSTSNLIQYIKTESDEDDCGGSEPELQTLHQLDHHRSLSSESDTDDSEDWGETSNTHSGSNNEENSKVPVGEPDAVEESRICSKCGNKFRSLSGLTLHFKSCSGLSSGKQFNRRENLEIDMKSPTGKTTFNCSLCGKCFSQKRYLTKHLTHHTGGKPFICPYCGKGFTHNGALNSHMRIHTGVKPFCCSYCGKFFRQKGTLNDHMRIHTGEKPYSCSLCQKAFTQSTNLNRHMRIHNR